MFFLRNECIFTHFKQVIFAHGYHIIFQHAKACCKLPVNMLHAPSIGATLVLCLRRWPNIDPTLGERLVFAGLYSKSDFKFVTFALHAFR